MNKISCEFLLLPLLSCLLASSCRDDHRAHISRMASEWRGKTVAFPANPVFVAGDTDTVRGIRLNPPSSYKIINYVDSTGCVSCKLLLPAWNLFIAELDSLTRGQVPVYFVMNGCYPLLFMIYKI